MNKWSLPQLLSSLHNDIQHKLKTARCSLVHPVTKGDASEKVWIDLLTMYLPARYQVETAHVVDSNGNFSDQIDIVVFDRQYSPFIFKFQDSNIVPVESIYAVFESKQAISAKEIKYAKNKVKTVRSLHRTSLPIPHAGGTYPAKMPSHILGGLLTFESNWKKDLKKSLIQELSKTNAEDRIDLGCVAAHGMFDYTDNLYSFKASEKAAASFLFELIGRLQSVATVPMVVCEMARCLIPDCNGLS